jgi:hypothetical protein
MRDTNFDSLSQPQKTLRIQQFIRKNTLKSPYPLNQSPSALSPNWQILVRKSEFDEWISQYQRCSQDVDLDSLVNEVMNSLG